MRFRRGLRLKDKNTGRVVTLKRRGGMGHWDCACGKKNHKIHEGTLTKYYEEEKDDV